MRILPILIALTFLGCNVPTPKYKRTEYVIVDSVWVIPTGTTSTLQFDPIYKCRAGNMKFTTSPNTKIGDTITIKWIRY